MNFYASKDSLCGHHDDAEETFTKPIVSISLSLPAVFLIAKDRESPVFAIVVESGDAVVMAGESRTFCHGVPRVFSREEIDVPASAARLHSILELSFAESDAHVNSGTQALIKDYLSSHRININVRQVAESDSIHLP